MRCFLVYWTPIVLLYYPIFVCCDTGSDTDFDDSRTAFQTDTHNERTPENLQGHSFLPSDANYHEGDVSNGAAETNSDDWPEPNPTVSSIKTELEPPTWRILLPNVSHRLPTNWAPIGSERYPELSASHTESDANYPEGDVYNSAAETISDDSPDPPLSSVKTELEPTSDRLSQPNVLPRLFPSSPAGGASMRSELYPELSASQTESDANYPEGDVYNGAAETISDDSPDLTVSSVKTELEPTSDRLSQPNVLPRLFPSSPANGASMVSERYPELRSSHTESRIGSPQPVLISPEPSAVAQSRNTASDVIRVPQYSSFPTVYKSEGQRTFHVPQHSILPDRFPTLRDLENQRRVNAPSSNRARSEQSLDSSTQGSSHYDPTPRNAQQIATEDTTHNLYVPETFSAGRKMEGQKRVNTPSVNHTWFRDPSTKGTNYNDPTPRIPQQSATEDTAGTSGISSHAHNYEGTANSPQWKEEVDLDYDLGLRIQQEPVLPARTHTMCGGLTCLGGSAHTGIGYQQRTSDIANNERSLQRRAAMASFHDTSEPAQKYPRLQSNPSYGGGGMMNYASPRTSHQQGATDVAPFQNLPISSDSTVNDVRHATIAQSTPETSGRSSQARRQKAERSLATGIGDVRSMPNYAYIPNADGSEGTYVMRRTTHQLAEFIFSLLEAPEVAGHLIRWENRDQRIFAFQSRTQLAQLARKDNSWIKQALDDKYTESGEGKYFLSTYLNGIPLRENTYRFGSRNTFASSRLPAVLQ